MISSYHPHIIESLRKDLEKEPPNSIADDSSVIPSEKAINFSLKWLKEAMPCNFRFLATQTVDKELPIYEYECPRCESEADYESEDITDENCSLLKLNYRFWFCLKDNTGRLDPCLIEGDLARRMVNGIDPGKYMTDGQKMGTANWEIMHRLKKNYLFTIDTFEMPWNGPECEPQSYTKDT